MRTGVLPRLLRGSVLSAITVAALAGTPTRAYARGIVIMGAGETITHYADADLSGDPELAQELAFREPSIGFEYECFSLFFIDVWTGGGRIVLYDQSSDRYVPLDDDLLLELTGRDTASFGEPFFYRVPPGWILGGLALLGVALVTWRRMRELP